MSEPASPPPPLRPSWRRHVRRIVLALVVLSILLVLAVLGGIASLRSTAVRQAILARVADYAARELGLPLTAEDFRFLGWSGIEVRGLRLGVPGAPPLLTAERAVAHVDLFSLRQETAVIRSLEVFSPRVDLSAPVPEIPESEGPPGFEVQRINLHQATVIGAPLEGAAAEWVRSWQIAGIEARGSFRNGPWDLTVDTADARIDRPGLAPLALRIAGRVDSRPNEPLRIERLQATGDGLRLTGSGRLGLEEGGPVEAAFDIEADPKLLGAGVPPGGLIRARGDLRLPESAGRAVLNLQAVPAEALKPYLEESLFADLSLAGTVADGQADLAFGPGDLARIAGEAQVVWRRGDRRFAQVEVGIVPGKEVPLRLAFSADLLPGSPGRRHAEGVITGSGWAELADGMADGIEAEVLLPDVAAALAEARKLWPRLVPALPEGLPVQGALAATGRLEGRLTTPDATLDVTWKPDPTSQVHLRAKGRPDSLTGTAEAELSNVSLALLPGSAGVPPAGEASAAGAAPGRRDAGAPRGVVSGHLTLSGSPRGYRTQANLEATALAVPEKVSIQTAQIKADGTTQVEPLAFRGTVHLAGTGLDAPGKAQVPGFEATVEGDLTADPSAIRARISLDAPRVVLTEPATEISNLHLEADADAREVRISALSGSLPEERTFAASGRFTLDPLLDEADLDLQLARPVDAVQALDLSASLRSGVVGISAPRIETDAGRANLRATVPLGALEQIPALAEGIRGLPIERAQGPIALRLEAPELDSRPLLAALGMEPRPEHVQTGLLADLTFDPATPAAGRGEIRLDGLEVETPDARVAAEGPVTARLGDGTLEILPARLRIDSAGIEGAGLDLHGKADLDPRWRPFDDPPEKLVTRIAAEAGGTLEASLLNPYLEGGIAAGTLTLRANVSGKPDDLTADVRASGRGASFVWPSPYVTRIQDPEIALSWRQDRWTLDTGKAAWNGGTLDLAGGGGPEGIGLDVDFARVRYRVDYGVSTQLSGRLALRVPPGEEARSSLSGRITVDRAVLDRDINLDREVLSLFRAPDSTPGTEETFLSRLDLDLQVATVDGVRVRNNVADLRASWRPLTVSGTAEVPVLRGRIDIDPGGRLLVYSQTVRIDRGSLVFTGDPLLDPRTDFSTTSTLQDPTIAQLRGEASPLALLDRPKDLEDEPGLGETLTAGLAGYYGARVVSKVGESLGLQRLRVDPVLVLEDDPSARLFVSTDLSENVSYTLSVDLRNAGRQGHLLSLHGFRELPGMQLQGFSNDEGEEGASLQQALAFGGSEPRQEGPRLRRLKISARGGLWTRLLRRSIRLQKRDPVPESAAFDIEVDLAETLRRRGYPDPQIRVEVTPASGSRWVDIAVTVEPGMHATFLFEGDRLAKADRTAVTTLYRPDFYEPIALEEMKKEAVRAFRRRGHLDPRVEIEVQRDKPDERTVILRAAAGPQTEIADLEIAGLDAGTALLAARRFPPETLARAELAAGLPDADRRLLDALRRLGFPSARIAGRDLDRKKLTVRVEPGLRQLLGSVDIAGVEDPERERLLALLPVRSGGPARLDLVSEGALRLERDLEARGYPDASVGVAVQPSGDSLAVLYKVDPGPKVQIAGIDFAGERWSRPSRLERATGLRPGAPLSNAQVEEARARLLQTGVFSQVTAEIDRAAEEATGGEARVTFSLAERPRFRLGYGARWQSDRGTSAVIDAVDSNFLGRGMTLGLLGLYEPEDRSGRLYLQTGTLLGTDVSLETYLQARRTLSEEGFVEDSREASLQLARPFGRRTTGRVYTRYRMTHLFEEEPDPFFPLDLEISRPYMGTQLLQDGRDDRIDPTRGYFASVDLSGSGAFLGSDFHYARLFTQLQLHRSFALAGRSMTWAQSFRAGLARPFSGQELLREERFFAGGEFSVRGYETDSLGPEEVLGSFVRPLGGEALLVINEELRVRLPWDLTGLLFLDAGQVWEEPGDVDWSFAKSLGLGLRARTPVGLLRFDAGFPLDRREGDESYRLYFGFGNAF